MMLATPMPPTQRVSAPMMPRKSWMPMRILVSSFAAVHRVPRGKDPLVGRVETVLGSEDLAHLEQRRLHLRRVLHLDHEGGQAVLAVLGAEGADRDHSVVGVRPLVAAHLQLVDQHPDDQVGDVVDQHASAPPGPRRRKISPASSSPRKITRRRNLLIQRVEESAARRSQVVAHLAVVDVHPVEPRVDAALAVAEQHAPVDQFAGDALDVGYPRRISSMSSIRGRIGRPAGIPCQGIVVSLGHITARFRPIPACASWSCRLRPSPKESISNSASEPQAMAATVSIARFFCTRDERRKSCSTSRGRRQHSCLHRHDRVQLRRAARGEVPGDQSDQCPAAPR